MIASHHLDLPNNQKVELPQYADSIIFEVKGTGSYSVQFEHSADGVNWYDIGSALTSDSIMALNNASEHILLNVRAVITGSGTTEIVRVHFRRHKR